MLRSESPARTRSRHQAVERSRTWDRWLPYLLATAFFAAYATLSLARLHRMATRSWDLAIFEQIVSGWAHLQWPVADIKAPGFPALGDHFSPMLAVFGPFYRVFPSPATLLVGQALLVALSIVPVTRVAMRLLGRATGITIGAAYGLSWGLQTAVDFDFHEICLALPLLALSLEALLTRRWRACVLWALPLVLVKEDLGLTVLAIGVVLMIRGQRRIGAGLAAFGALSFALVIGVVIPLWNPQGRYDYWTKLGDGSNPTSLLGGAEAGLSVIAHALTPAVKLQTLLLLLGITGFLALRSSLVLVAIPTMAWRFLSGNDYYWGHDWHYNALVMPILFIALVDGIALARGSSRSWLRAYAVRVPAISLTAALLLCTQFPFKDLVDPATYQSSSRQAAATAALAVIPDGTSVESDLGLITQLVPDHTVYWIGAASGVDPDYIAIDSSSWPAPADLPDYAEQLHPGAVYTILFSQDDYTILHRIDTTDGATP